MGVVEFGPSDRRKRAIVPRDERIQAERDAHIYGFGYLHDERRMDPRKVEVLIPEEAPEGLVVVINQWLEKKEQERHAQE